jgi:hypothetical protein
MLAQEPAQQIPCAVRRAPAEHHQRGPIERQPETDIGLQGIRAIEACEIVMELGRLGLVSGCPREGGRIAGKRRGEARRDVAPDEIAFDAGVGIRLVVDPLETGSASICVDRSARQRQQRPQQRWSRAGDRYVGMAARSAGPAPRKSCGASGLGRHDARAR